MSRRGHPYDNVKAESFMKTSKAEPVYLVAYETFENVTADLPPWIKLTPPNCVEILERVKGIEPSCAAWEAAVLPLNYTRAPTGF
jgi:transposase InsO family protein